MPSVGAELILRGKDWDCLGVAASTVRAVLRSIEVAQPVTLRVEVAQEAYPEGLLGKSHTLGIQDSGNNCLQRWSAMEKILGQEVGGRPLHTALKFEELDPERQALLVGEASRRCDIRIGINEGIKERRVLETVVKHEMYHSLGISKGNPLFEKHISRYCLKRWEREHWLKLALIAVGTTFISTAYAVGVIFLTKKELELGWLVLMSGAYLCILLAFYAYGRGNLCARYFKTSEGRLIEISGDGHHIGKNEGRHLMSTRINSLRVEEYQDESLSREMLKTMGYQIA